MFTWPEIMVDHMDINVNIAYSYILSTGPCPFDLTWTKNYDW